jgi:hypothetical protein
MMSARMMAAVTNPVARETISHLDPFDILFPLLSDDLVAV